MMIPEQGRSKEEIFSALREYRKRDLPWRSGKVLAYCFHAGDEVEQVAKEAYLAYLGENALDPTAYPSVHRMETDVVRMIATLLRGDERVVGNFTSGGTESILLAVKTSRDKARADRPAIRQPEMVLPRSAHCAFHKAASYFDVKPVVVPFDRRTFRADVNAMRDAITENTILLVASAPGYAQGVVDPVPEIGALAREKGALFHVDGCVGGIPLSFLRRMGEYSGPDFDFSVPGVTSISADLHKYGYTAKGASVILYRDKEIRRHQIFASTASTSYALINATIQSTKTSGPIAAAWAVLNYIGENGYRRIVHDVMDATRRLVDGVNATGDLGVLGTPDAPMFSMASEAINIFELADEMSGRGWYIQPQLSTPISPPNLHVSVTASTVPLVDAFLDDLRASLAGVKASDTPVDRAAIKAMVDDLLSSSASGEYGQLLALGGLDGAVLPEKMAIIHTMMDVLPRPVVEELLIGFWNDLYA